MYKGIHRKNNVEINRNTMEECYILTISTRTLINIGESITFITLVSCSLIIEQKPNLFGVFHGY